MPCDPTIYVCAQDRGKPQAPPEIENFELILNAPHRSPNVSQNKRILNDATKSHFRDWNNLAFLFTEVARENT